MKLFCKLIAIAALLMVAIPSWAQTATTSIHASDKIMGTMNFFYYSDANDQGGKELPGGATMLTGLNLQYNAAQYFTGVGLFSHSDTVGKTQTNAATGIKFDFFLPSLPYYFEYGYAFSAEQTFSNRAAQSRAGKMSYLALGIRVPLTTWLFFDGSFKQRQWLFDTEDGVSLSSPIQKVERMPFLGFGIAFNI